MPPPPHKTTLTRRECQIVDLLRRGRSAKEMALDLALSPRTINHTLERTYRKLRVQSNLAALYAMTPPRCQTCPHGLAMQLGGGVLRFFRHPFQIR